MHPDARLPRQMAEGVAGVGIEGEGIDREPGVAAGLVGALPVVINGIADSAVNAQPKGVAVVLAGKEPRARSRDDPAASVSNAWSL
jgi:hypothetical protein